ncbi:MAG TPA: hypothetical protein VLH38_02685 [Patescibacteria group bacterium]|nr:hypothetical protein [Patescibacteria group bacterium]
MPPMPNRDPVFQQKLETEQRLAQQEAELAREIMRQEMARRKIGAAAVDSMNQGIELSS